MSEQINLEHYEQNPKNIETNAAINKIDFFWLSLVVATLGALVGYPLTELITTWKMGWTNDF